MGWSSKYLYTYLDLGRVSQNGSCVWSFHISFSTYHWPTDWPDFNLSLSQPPNHRRHGGRFPTNLIFQTIFQLLLPGNFQRREFAPFQGRSLLVSGRLYLPTNKNLTRSFGNNPIFADIFCFAHRIHGKYICQHEYHNKSTKCREVRREPIIYTTIHYIKKQKNIYPNTHCMLYSPTLYGLFTYIACLG